MNFLLYDVVDSMANEPKNNNPDINANWKFFLLARNIRLKILIKYCGIVFDMVGVLYVYVFVD